MPTKRVPLQRSRRRLSNEEEWSLLFGEVVGREAFSSMEEYRAAWFQHRDELLREWMEDPRAMRPWAWWLYESPVCALDDDYRKATLYEAGLLTESERAELLADWRGHFTHAQELHGRARRRAFYRWAGIPRKLLVQWTRERVRQARRLRGLMTEPAPAA